MTILLVLLRNEYLRLGLLVGLKAAEAITRVRLLLFYIKYFVKLLLCSSNIEFSRNISCVNSYSNF
jgi:hypothetical protein